MNIGAKLRELREARGLTQDQLAERSGVPAGTIRNYEQGRHDPAWGALWVLAEALGVGRGPLYDTFRACVGVEAGPQRRPGRPPKVSAPPSPQRGRGTKGPPVLGPVASTPATEPQAVPPSGGRDAGELPPAQHKPKVRRARGPRG